MSSTTTMKKNKEPGVEEDATTVVLRRREVKAGPPPSKSAPTLTSPYSFMRRSCTFVAESSLGLRKSASRTTSGGQAVGIRTSLKETTSAAATAPQKVVKDRRNLALQVRQKKDMLEENVNGESRANGRLDEGVGGGGRMSRLVGGLRAWSSTEDVRSFFGRTVSVIKQQPVSRKVKQAFTPTTRPSSSHPDSAKTTSAKSNNIKNTTTTTSSSRKQPSKVKSTRPVDHKTDKQPAKTQAGKFQFGKAGAGKSKTFSPSPAPAPSPGQTNPR